MGTEKCPGIFSSPPDVWRPKFILLLLMIPNWVFPILRPLWPETPIAAASSMGKCA